MVKKIIVIIIIAIGLIFTSSLFFKCIATGLKKEVKFNYLINCKDKPYFDKCKKDFPVDIESY